MRQRACANVTVPLTELNAPAPRVVVGPYTIIAPLAKGGTGSVFLAEHETTKERVALKMLHPAYAGHSDVVDRLFEEHEVSCAVTHYALLDVRAAATTASGMPYLVMEYLDGENLGSLVERGRLEIEAILAISTQIAGGLAALHRAGFAHCDIKPDNIFVLYQASLDGYPLVKVIDYGVATRTDAKPCEDSTIAGTPAYMPPEQWRGRATPKSDVYALGCTMYELVTGEQPFQGTLPQLMLSHSQFVAEPPSEVRANVPPALERLIMRMLAKDPAMRPSAIEVEAELQNIARAILPLDALELDELDAVA